MCIPIKTCCPIKPIRYLLIQFVEINRVHLSYGYILCMLYTCIENLNGALKKKYWKLRKSVKICNNSVKVHLHVSVWSCVWRLKMYKFWNRSNNCQSHKVGYHAIIILCNILFFLCFSIPRITTPLSPFKSEYTNKYRSMCSLQPSQLYYTVNNNSWSTTATLQCKLILLFVSCSDFNFISNSLYFINIKTNFFF